MHKSRCHVLRALDVSWEESMMQWMNLSVHCVGVEPCLGWIVELGIVGLRC